TAAISPGWRLICGATSRSAEPPGDRAAGPAPPAPQQSLAGGLHIGEVFAGDRPLPGKEMVPGGLVSHAYGVDTGRPAQGHGPLDVEGLRDDRGGVHSEDACGTLARVPGVVPGTVTGDVGCGYVVIQQPLPHGSGLVVGGLAVTRYQDAAHASRRVQ